MISYEQFEDIVVNILERDISSNEDQKKAITSPSDKSLFIVAGPGSGKTTVMVLKILKYIFVDDINPNEILATTFTRKAADELYSRILGWGDEIKNHLIDNISDENFDDILKIDRIDFNQIKVGTTDSIAEELLRDYKKPGENQSVVIEEFVANSAMIKILIEDEKYLNKGLVEYVKEITGREKFEEPSKISEVLMEVKNRIYYDQVDFDEVYNKTQEGSGVRLALDCIKEYEETLENRNTIDFAMLEACIREDLNKRAPRAMAVLDPVKLVITNYPADKTEYFTVTNNPNDESAGTRQIPFTRELYVDREDVSTNPPPKYFRLKEGGEVRLMGAYIVKCDKIITDDDGNVTEVLCTADLQSGCGNPFDGRKIKGTIHWLSQAHAVKANVMLYDRLFTTPDPSNLPEGKTYNDFLNPDSLKKLENCFMEPSLAEARPGDKFQFVRMGYFCLDTKNENTFNRVVTLKDSYKVQ